MNKEYKIVGDKAIVTLDDQESYITDYYDGMDEVLKQENLIEILEKKVNNLEKKKISEVKKPKSLIDFFSFVTLPFLASPILLMLITGSDLQTVLALTQHTMFGELKAVLSLPIFFDIAVFGPLGLFKSISDYSTYKNKLNTKNAIDIELNELQIMLTNEKEKLKAIKNKYKATDVKDAKNTIDLEVKETKKEIDTRAELYYDLGYDFETFYEKYKNGNLESYLKKHYENVNKDEVIAIIEQEVKEVENRESSKQLKRVLK